jgi:hypothetical protein
MCKCILERWPNRGPTRCHIKTEWWEKKRYHTETNEVFVTMHWFMWCFPEGLNCINFYFCFPLFSIDNFTPNQHCFSTALKQRKHNPGLIYTLQDIFWNSWTHPILWWRKKFNTIKFYNESNKHAELVDFFIQLSPFRTYCEIFEYYSPW